MAPDLDFIITQLAWSNKDTSMAVWVFDAKHVIGETTAEFAMQPEGVGCR
jgi:hypothetical protein